MASSRPAGESSEAGVCPIAMNTPSIGVAEHIVLILRRTTPLTFERAIVAGHLLEHGVHSTSIFDSEQPVLQDLLGAEAVAPMRNRDLGGKVGENSASRLPCCRADDENLLAAVEEARRWAQRRDGRIP